MKKTLLIVGSIAVLIAIAAVGAGVYIISTPEYALKGIIEDVNARGLEGLYPHLTLETREKIDAVSSVGQNGLFNTVIGFISNREYVSVLKSEIQEIQWGVDDVMKGKKNAEVILSFNYKDKLTGTIGLSMIRENRAWKISGLELPKFSEINF